MVDFEKHRDNDQPVLTHAVIAPNYVGDYLDSINLPSLPILLPAWLDNTVRQFRPGKEKYEYYNRHIADESHAVESIGSIKTTSQLMQNTFEKNITAEQFNALLQSQAGHEITFIVTDLLRHSQTGKFRPFDAGFHRQYMKPHEIQIYQQCIDQVIDSQRISAKNVPDLAFNVWKLLKERQIFYKKPQNSKHKKLYDGTQIKAEKVAWQWNWDFEHLAFEEAVFGAHSLRVKQYCEQDLFASDPLTLGVECDPINPLVTAMPTITHIDFGAFKIQYRGMVDWLLRYKNQLPVIIDQRYGHNEELFSLENRLQVLLYSLSVKKVKGMCNFESMNPNGVVFLYQVYNPEKSSFDIVDATLQPEEMPYLLNQLFLYALYWKNSYEICRDVDSWSRQAVIMPHLPYPDETVKLAQDFIEKPAIASVK